MPKPVLSDSLFNADDVATAILNQANLSVTNQDFAVSDRSGVITPESNVNIYNVNMYTFNGFAFVSLEMVKTGGISGTTETVFTISDSDLHPSSATVFNAIGFGPDSAEFIRFETNGNCDVYSTSNTGSSNLFLTINGVYRFA